MSAKLPDGLSQRFWTLVFPPNNNEIGTLLQPGETWIGTWNDVGLYEGNRKVPTHQVLTVYLTTHRLILCPMTSGSSSTASKEPSLATELRHIRQTEFYTGFMRSSPKITLTLGIPIGDGGTVGQEGQAESSAKTITETNEAWVCAVCGYANVGPNKCALCGVSGQKRAGGVTGGSGSSGAGVPASIPGTPDPSGTPRRSLDVAAIKLGNDSSSTVAVAAAKEEISCPVCTFLNHPSLRSCEICGTALPRKDRDRPGSSGAPARPSTSSAAVNASSSTATTEIVRLSFRKDGPKVAYQKLKSVLGQKAWERDTESSAPRSSTQNGTSTPTTSASRVGIDGVMATLSLSSQTRTDNLSSAFADLEVLMVRAGEMVKLAQNLNERLTAQQKAGTALPGNAAEREEEATLIRSSLVQLGLPAPALTSDMVKSDEEYHEGLAKELGTLLTGSNSKGGSKGKEEVGLMLGKDGRGVIGLDEAWGLWMRARGVALLSPSTLISVLPYLPTHTAPSIRSQTLPSGLRVLYTPIYAPSNIFARLLEMLSPDVFPNQNPEPAEEREKSLSLLEIAAAEGLPIGLAKELMEEVDKINTRRYNLQKGVIAGLVKDEQAEQGSGGVRWYRDIISGWEL